MQETKPTEKRGALRKFTKSPFRSNMVLPTLSLSREREEVYRASPSRCRKALACTRDNKTNTASSDKTTKGTIGDNGSFCLVKNS